MRIDSQGIECNKYLKITFSFVFFIILISHSFADERSRIPSPIKPSIQFSGKYDKSIPPPALQEKPPGLLTSEQWAVLIDETWGWDIPYPEQMMIWMSFWSNVDENYAGFEGLDANIWDDVWNRYYPDIYDTVSHGRLAAILAHSCRAIRDGHTVAFSDELIWTMLLPGVPLMMVEGWGDVTHFGAGLTVLSDSSLLVYKAIPDHPLGLEPGDLILGYHGVPWKQLYRDLLEAELPLSGSFCGSDSSHPHAFMIAAGENWHLFDTIDVVKYPTDDTLHLPTELMINSNTSAVATEQMDIPGVPFPDVVNDELTSWGIIEGTNIGYIYSYGWLPTEDSASIVNYWMDALNALQNDHNVSGLIIDIRVNLGTSFSFQKVINRMFDFDDKFLNVDERCGGHLDFCRFSYFEYFFEIRGTRDSRSWDKPIAILIGPGAVSGGDFYPMVFSRHPLAKMFGKPTSGAFGGMSYPNLADGWFQMVGNTSSYLIDNPGHHLLHSTFPASDDNTWVEFESVWLTREGVVNGRDDVVEAAVAWINSRDTDDDGVLNENDNCPDDYNPEQVDENGNNMGDICEFICGDANVDQSVNVGDAVYIINNVFKGGPPPETTVAGDANNDGVCNVGDAVYIINTVFKGGPEPCAAK